MKKSNSLPLGKNVCVLGLGYIGLPTASMFATHGFHVHGVDVNSSIVQTIQEGKVHIEEPGLATVVKAALASGNMDVGTRPQAADVYVLAVPTPYRQGKTNLPEVDLSYVESSLESILPFLKKGNLVILESTCPPGTTRDLIIPTIEKRTRFIPGRDIGVAYCPERVIPGRALKELIGNDRLVGSIDRTWGEYTRKLYRAFVSGEIFVTDPTVAEMAKLLENTYRDVNIALANEVARICEHLRISVWEVIELANRHPRVNVHKPGPGVGGHCISVDPWFLVEKFPDLAKLIHLSRSINNEMPDHVVEMIADRLGGTRKAKVAVLGLAYKGNVDDDRESPSIHILRKIQSRFSEITLGVYDPHVKSKEFPTQGIEAAFREADLAVLLTPHDEYRYMDPMEIGPLMKNRVLLDTHNVLKAERWVPAGFELITLGTGTVHPAKTIQTT